MAAALTSPSDSLVSAHSEGTCLAVKLQPRSSKTGIVGVVGGELKVSVTAPPVDAAANDALVRLLAEKLDCARAAVQIIRGKTSRHKLVLVRGLDAGTIRTRLGLGRSA